MMLSIIWQNVIMLKKKYELAKKYFLIAIEKGHCIAMNILGDYYYNMVKNYELVKKYYLMAIDNGYTGTTNNLKSIENYYSCKLF